VSELYQGSTIVEVVDASTIRELGDYWVRLKDGAWTVARWDGKSWQWGFGTVEPDMVAHRVEKEEAACLS
jgi:hypothetical protein